MGGCCCSDECVYYLSPAFLHSGDVFPGEGIGGVADQQTGLTHSTVGKRDRAFKNKTDKRRRKSWLHVSEGEPLHYVSVKIWPKSWTNSVIYWSHSDQ